MPSVTLEQRNEGPQSKVTVSRTEEAEGCNSDRSGLQVSGLCRRQTQAIAREAAGERAKLVGVNPQPSRIHTHRLPFRWLASAFATLAIALVLSACGDSHEHSQGAQGGQAQNAAGNQTDAGFVAGMIPHHEGALEMARLAQSRAQHPELRKLADQILASQTTEIAEMKKIQPTLPKAGGHDGHMGMSDKEMGMDGDMEDLRNAKPFDKAFLEMMIPHHEGAVRMAKLELAKGKNRQVKALARNIESSQAKEIAQMRKWLFDWYGAKADPAGGHMAGAHGN